MSETATEQSSTDAETDGEQQSANQEPDWKAEARKWEQRAKENKTQATALERAQRAAMSENDRALAEAETKGRTAATSEFGKRLAREKFDSIAGRRNPDFDTAAALEWVDMTKFIDDNGEPNVKAITDAVGRLVPEHAGGVPSFDGGTRKTATKPPTMNDLIRKAAGYGG